MREPPISGIKAWSPDHDERPFFHVENLVQAPGLLPVTSVHA